MNEKLKELYHKAHDTSDVEGSFPQYFSATKFANLIVKEHLKLLQLQWYELNNREVTGEETPRDIGFRVGQKAEIITLMEKIKQHFGIENE